MNKTTIRVHLSSRRWVAEDPLPWLVLLHKPIGWNRAEVQILREARSEGFARLLAKVEATKRGLEISK